MATATNHLSSSSSSTYTSSKFSNLSDLLQKYYTIIESLKQNHESEVQVLNKRIKSLEFENQHLRSLQEQHPHSIFDINYVSFEASTISQLQSELEQARKQINTLQNSLDQQYSECEEVRTKYNLQRLMNENHFDQQNPNSDSDSNKVKELELKLKHITDQINQFDQCNYESEEQIRLLKQLISNNEQDQTKTIAQSLTVKQSDLVQQTNIVENLLNKQHDKILHKIEELLNQNPQQNSQTTTKNKKIKKKRL
ncbi:unnamed protein product [Rotaria magnacalcarata]|nr:unnamed protein product [Rotaria magnacalcarata]CAF1620402.1 unnamed protein product [Rotaria magnacalcarata]CAF2081652.1 unnamed protein product [Rotaria magnacalcarata]CAF2090878.1 unnamed protein product [Rotaria magnacalcarata]CAF2108944.1 unnamed protein product [Rotaria magnacalcarata]